MSLDKNLTFKKLNVKTKENSYWNSHWESIRKYLEDSAPCIYLPNYDHHTAAVSPILSDDILIIGIVHSDEESYYETVKSLGRYWNGIVAVSDSIYENIKDFDQYNKDKIFKIDYGVKVADEIPIKNVNNNIPIKLIYTGRLVQIQKRISDLPKIMQRLSDKKVNFNFSIVGNGSEEDIIKKECKSFINKGICKFYGTMSNDNVFEILRNSDLFILTSEYEGKPLALLEAMGQGCVPVVSDIQSGIPELIENGRNGYIVPIGDIEKFADCIEYLSINRNKLKELSSMAFQKVNSDIYKIETKEPIVIGKHAIVGTSSIIIPGVTLAEGTSIGAMSMVTKTTAPWSIYFGIPAKKIKNRKNDLLDLGKKYLNACNEKTD